MATAALDSFVDKMKTRHDPNVPRNRLREARVGLRAMWAAMDDTTQTHQVFDALENFPLRDILEWQAGQIPLTRDPRLVALWKSGKAADLRTPTVLKMLDYPQGSLGRSFAEFIQRFELQNDFLNYRQITTAAEFLMFRIAHTHDLLHFILGYRPFETMGEMEVEAFLAAQTRGLNHGFFMFGHAMYALRYERYKLPLLGKRLKAAYELGQRAQNLLLHDWDSSWKRPLKDVKQELGIGNRRTWGVEIDIPTPPPALSHVVFNVPNLSQTSRFYREQFSLKVAAQDPRLGALFMTDGRDHHTLAMQESWPLNPLGFLRAAVKNTGRLRGLIQSSRSGARSRDNRPTVFPPLAVILGGMRQGLNHVGYRVQDEQALRIYYDLLVDAGIKVEWQVNHNEMAKAIYFKDPNGNFCELFADGDVVKEMQAKLDRGETTLNDLRVNDFYNYELDLEHDTAPAAPR